jgi:hypothetical protein
MSSNGYISLAAAGRAIGMRGHARYIARRLKRVLLAKERRTKKPIMLRVEGPNGHVRYRVTLPLLRKRCPELFDRRDEIADLLGATFATLKSQISDLYRRDAALKDAIKSLQRNPMGPKRTVTDRRKGP